MARKLTFKKRDISNGLKLIGAPKTSISVIASALLLGLSVGIAYEEWFGIGTWHKFHPPTEKLNICFTPPSGCIDLIAIEIANAQKSVYVQAYGLTSQLIIHHLKEAKARGLEVAVILDDGSLSDNDAVYQELQQHNIEVYADKMPGIAHNKVMIIDGIKTLTGSFNFTKAADTRNAENVLLIEDQDIAAQYLSNWQNRRDAAINRDN